MSAITRCRRMNSWLASKRLCWALPGRAGDTVVKTTVYDALIPPRKTSLFEVSTRDDAPAGKTEVDSSQLLSVRELYGNARLEGAALPV